MSTSHELREAVTALRDEWMRRRGGSFWVTDELTRVLDAVPDVPPIEAENRDEGDPCPKHRARGVNPGCPDCDQPERPDPPAVDRDKLAWWLADVVNEWSGSDKRRTISEFLADAILSSGVLLAAAGGRARALEDAADALEHEESPGDDTTLHFPSLLREMHVATTTAKWLRDRAVSERDRRTT